jgi:hypothetical protein
MLDSEFLEISQKMWNEILNCEEREKIKKILAIDVKRNAEIGVKSRKQII